MKEYKPKQEKKYRIFFSQTSERYGNVENFVSEAMKLCNSYDNYVVNIYVSSHDLKAHYISVIKDMMIRFDIYKLEDNKAKFVNGSFIQVIYLCIARIENPTTAMFDGMSINNKKNIKLAIYCMRGVNYSFSKEDRRIYLGSNFNPCELLPEEF